MVAIPDRAGLGVATLYRRFPTEEDLLAEAFAEQMDECAHLLDDALADPDPSATLTATNRRTRTGSPSRRA